MKLNWLGITLIFAFLAPSAFADLGGVHGRYTDYLDELFRTGEYSKLVKNPSDEPVNVTCLETPGQRFYIGIVQNMKVKAPLEKLTQVVADIGSYVELFPDYAAIRVESKQGNRLVTFWEQKVPVFFVPNGEWPKPSHLGESGPTAWTEFMNPISPSS